MMLKARLVAILVPAFVAGCAGPRVREAQAAPPPPRPSQPVASPAPVAPLPSVAAPFDKPPLLPGTPDVATLVAKVKPVVVTVITAEVASAPRGRFPFGGGDRDEGFRRHGLGSGFIVDAKGHVVTNAHVVADADRVRVRLADERELDAKVRGKDSRLDLAVLELVNPPANLPVASLGASGNEELRVGEYVVAIGAPFGLGHTVTMGIVSAKGRAIGAGPYDDFIQTDASINPGNSGGPLFNLKGQVVGINTAINPNGRGIGFAIPVDSMKDVVPQLIARGTVTRGRLGLAFQPVDAGLAKALGMDHPKGALVGEVERGGAAEKAGIQSGDVILAVGGVEVSHAQELPRLVARNSPGTKVTVRLVRGKLPRDVDVVLDELRDESAAKPAPPTPGTPKLGMELGDAPGGGALVQRTLPGSPADEALEKGDVILEVNRRAVGSAAEAARAMEAAGGTVLLKIRRGAATRFVAIER